MIQITKVLCARCRVPIEGPTEPKPDDRMSCPGCGIGDSYEATMAEVQDYIREMAAKGLSEMFDHTSTKSDSINLRANYKPSGRVWRFIAEIEF